MLNSQQLAQLSVFKEFYRLVRRLFGIDIALIDPDGRRGAMLGQGREMNRFCRRLQADPEGLLRCMACDARHARAALAEQRPLRYVCHAGLTEFIIPVVVDRIVAAHLQCGQLAGRALTAADWHRIRPSMSWFSGDMAALRRDYLRSRVVAPGRQRDLTSLLQLIAHHAATAHAQQLMLDQHPRDRLVARIMHYLRTHCWEEVRLRQVAVAAGVSERSLVRVLREKTGCSLTGHLHRLRIARACEQLQGTDDKIADIAFACGFGSVQQFNRVFRVRMGINPRAWRRKTLRRETV